MPILMLIRGRGLVLGPDLRAGGSSVTAMAATVDERLAQTFVELADTLVAGLT